MHEREGEKEDRVGKPRMYCVCLIACRVATERAVSFLLAEFSVRTFPIVGAYRLLLFNEAGAALKTRGTTDSRGILRNTAVFPLPRVANKLTLFTDSRNSAGERAKSARRHMGYAQ